MNTLSPINYNRPNFKGFTQPNPDVLNHFRGVIGQLSPDGRQHFVEEMGKIVESVKDCPVRIDHAIVGSYEGFYTPMINNTPVKVQIKTAGVATIILERMKEAARQAKDIADANENFQKLKKIFNF